MYKQFQIVQIHNQLKIGQIIHQFKIGQTPTNCKLVKFITKLEIGQIRNQLFIGQLYEFSNESYTVYAFVTIVRNIFINCLGSFRENFGLAPVGNRQRKKTHVLK